MMRDRLCAALLGAALLATVASPVLRHRRPGSRDDFPLSHYPMFSARRGASGTVVHVEASDDDGSWPVPHHRLGAGGFNQVRRQIARRARTRDGAAALAREALVVLAHDARRPALVRVVRSTFSYDAFFAGDRTPLRVRELASARREDRR